MADKMLRIGGRDADGYARPIKTDARGNLAKGMADRQFLIPMGELKELTIPTYDGSNQPIHPSVVCIPRKFGDYKYWMAFTPYPHYDDTKENPSIVVSNDGYTWVVPPGLTNPIFPAPAAGFYADTTLLWDGTKLHLFWMHAGDGATKHYYSYSTDGITWADKAQVVGTTFGLRHGMCYVNGTFHCVSLPPTINEWQDMLVKQYSSNGLNYYPERPTITNLRNTCANHGSVYFDGAMFHFLTTCSPTKAADNAASLYYGASIDGHRVIYDLQPILIPKVGTWYERTVYTSCIVPGEDDTYFLYISGTSLDGLSSIGMMPVKLNLGAMDFSVVKTKFARTVFNAVEIRSTATVYSDDSLPEFNECKDKTLIVANSHDQPLVITLQQYLPGSVVDLRVGATQALQTITVPTRSQVYLTAADLAALGVIFPNAIRLCVKANPAPTEGNVTMIIGGA